MRKRKSVKPRPILSFTVAAVFAVLGAAILLRSQATTPFLILEPENGTIAGGAVVRTDATASADKAVTFAAPASSPAPAPTEVVISPKPLSNAVKTIIGGETYTSQSPNKPYSLSVDPDPSPAYARFELREGDRWINDSKKYPNDNRQRSELRGNTFLPMGRDVWLSGSVRVTANSWKKNGYNLITQFHYVKPEGEAAGMNALNISIVEGNLKIYTRGDTSVDTNTRPPSTTRFSRNWNPYIGKWAHFVIRARFSKASANGQLEVWLDGNRVVNASNIVMGFNNPQGPYSKMGIYRSGWTAPIVVEWANREVGTASLSSRITSPLPTPK